MSEGVQLLREITSQSVSLHANTVKTCVTSVDSSWSYLNLTITLNEVIVKSFKFALLRPLGTFTGKCINISNDGVSVAGNIPHVEPLLTMDGGGVLRERGDELSRWELAKECERWSRSLNVIAGRISWREDACGWRVGTKRMINPSSESYYSQED